MSNTCHMKGGSSSAGKMNIKRGTADHGGKFCVENGLWITSEELKRSAQAGVDYFNNKRPISKRVY